MLKDNLTIFIDESGTLPDRNDKFIVVSAVIVKQIREAGNLIDRVLKSLRQTKESLKLKELKFYHSRHSVRRLFLSAMVAAGFDIFALIVDKKNRKIVDGPENFALIIAELVSEISVWYRTKKINLMIDKHFHKQIDREKFDELLEEYLDKELNVELAVEHIDSQSNLTVNMADMSAGAVLWKYRGKDDEFYRIIRDNILVEKITNWPELKRKSVAQNKTHPNRRRRPSR